MTLDEAINLIRPMGVNGDAQQWADLGCGSGLFSRALASILPQGSHVLCMDKFDQNIGTTNANGVVLEFQKSDFSQYDFELNEFDGYLMANSLHCIRDQRALISKLLQTLRPQGKMMVIEYDTNIANQWVPFPITYRKLETLSLELGATHVRKVSETPSVFGSMMYSCEIGN